MSFSYTRRVTISFKTIINPKILKSIFRTQRKLWLSGSSDVDKLLRDSACRVHSIDARGEIPGILGTHVQNWTIAMDLGVSDEARKHIESYLNEVALNFLDVMEQVIRNDDYSKWSVRM